MRTLIRSRARRAAAMLAATALALTATPATSLPPAAAGAFSSTNVEVVAAFPDVTAIGGRLIGRYLYVTTVQGVRIYDTKAIPNERIPVLVGALDLPHWENEDVDTNGKILLVTHDSFPGPEPFLYVIDVSNVNAPSLLSVLRLPKPAGHTVSCLYNCKYAWVAGEDLVHVVDLRDPAAPKLAGKWDAPGRIVHDVQVDDRGIAWLSGDAGVYGFKPWPPARPKYYLGRGINPSNGEESAPVFNTGLMHNSLRPDAKRFRARSSRDRSAKVKPGELILITEEDWMPAFNNQCKSDGYFMTGWIKEQRRQTSFTMLDKWHVGQGAMPSGRSGAAFACSSHYFDVKGKVAAVAWYEQGIRFLDFSNPRNIRQIGYYMPAVTEVWSTMWVGNYLYSLDAARGLEVLKFTGKPGDKIVKSGPLNPLSPWSSRPSERFGYACRFLA